MDAGAANCGAFHISFAPVLMMVHGPERSIPRRVLDVAALAASVTIPLSMGAWSGSAGLLQRLMFLVAYLWYAIEALDTIGRRSAGQGP